MIEITKEEEVLIREFLCSDLVVGKKTNTKEEAAYESNLLDWLVKVEEDQKDFFMDMFGDEDMYNLLRRIVEQDPKVKKLISDTRAMIGRSIMIARSSAAPEISAVHKRRICALMLVATSHMQNYGLIGVIR